MFCSVAKLNFKFGLHILFTKFYTDSSSINIEYIIGSTYYENQKLEIKILIFSLIIKIVNLLLNECDVLISFIRKSVGIVRDILKLHFIKNINLGHFVSKSQ